MQLAAHHGRAVLGHTVRGLVHEGHAGHQGLQVGVQTRVEIEHVVEHVESLLLKSGVTEEHGVAGEYSGVTAAWPSH
jgi:hypothetical protein